MNPNPHLQKQVTNIVKNKSTKILLFIAAFIIYWQPVNSLAGITELIQQGDEAFKTNDIKSAETAYSKALELDPKNFRVLKSLAEIKFKAKKYSEAEKLVTQVLAAPISIGRSVLVHLAGETESLEAELVDETVMAIPVVSKNLSKNVKEKYLKFPVGEKIPHYRFFFKKAGKMKLVPKVTTRIQYVGVPPRVHEKMELFLAEIKKKIIASTSSDTKKEDEMVEIKEGCFLMGNKKGNADELPEHEICLSSFKMDKYEITQSSFQASMNRNPSKFVGANLPVERVNWLGADDYCRKKGKRLPTEAQWEYAARGGTKTKFYFGDEYVETGGNFCDGLCSNEESRNPEFTDGFPSTAPVGSFPPNPYGLYDMAGNVSEWVEDWFEANYYLVSPKKNPQGPPPSMYKVARGGSWLNSLEYLHSSRRAYLWPEFRVESQGFRCVLNTEKD
jgi:formylglycine-generating enzyme